MLYVRYGRAEINGQTIGADEAIYCDAPVALRSAGGVDANLALGARAAECRAGTSDEGTAILSTLRMSRVIAGLAMVEGTRWLFRLDRIVSAAGRIADRHQHPGPGIRCLVEGTFNVQQDVEFARDLAPGDAWWETGSDTVVAWGSRQIAAKFMRGMVLPVEWEGRVTGTWLSGHTPPTGNWKLYVDRVIAV